MWTTVSGKSAIFKQIQVIANNLANVNTSGFKAERLVFEKAAEKQGIVKESFQDDVAKPGRMNLDEFVQIKDSYTDFQQGGVQNTGSPYDLAIMGEGLFAVQTPEGVRYTRSGEFTRNEQGLLSTHEGHPVLGQGGPIDAAGGQFSVLDDGSVLIDGDPVDVIQVVKIDPQDLKRQEFQKFELREGGNVKTVSNPQVKSGAVESSNVNAVKELTNMINSHRLFQALQKTEESSGDMTQARNDIFGGRV